MIDKIKLFFKRIFGSNKTLLLEESTDPNSLLDEKLDINKLRNFKVLENK